MIAKPSCMNARRYEIMPQSIHLQQRRKLGRIAEVVGVHAFGQCRTSRRFGSDDPKVFTCKLARHEGKGKTSEVAAASTASDEHVRPFASQSKLLDGLQTNHG